MRWFSYVNEDCNLLVAFHISNFTASTWCCDEYVAVLVFVPDRSRMNRSVFIEAAESRCFSLS